MSQAQRAVIALFACLVIWLAAQSRMSWQHPILPSGEYPHQQSTAPATGGENPTQNPNWNNWTRDPIAVFTGLLTLFNGLLFVSTIGLWLATRKTAAISERALTDLERPYIFFHRIRSNLTTYLATNTTWNQESQSPEFFPELVNYGRTPGNMVFAAIYFEVGRTIPNEFLPPKVLSAPVNDPPSEWAEIIIGPDRKYRFSSQRLRHIFPFAYANGIREETMGMYCHGFIIYRDIFRNHHTTKWCRRYLPRRDQWQPEGGWERNNSN